MKTFVVLFCVGTALYVSAETNDVAVSRIGPVTPRAPVQLFATDPKAAVAPEGSSKLTATNNADLSLSLSNRVAGTTSPSRFELSTTGGRTEREIPIFHRLDAAGYLTPPAAKTGFSHFLDQTFRPEEIRLGKGTVTAQCTLYTAIKRKNPLCLLNPLFFSISW